MSRIICGIDIDELTLALRCCGHATSFICEYQGVKCPYLQLSNRHCGDLEKRAATAISRMAFELNFVQISYDNIINTLNKCGTSSCGKNCDGYCQRGCYYCDQIQLDAAAMIDVLYDQLKDRNKYFMPVNPEYNTNVAKKLAFNSIYGRQMINFDISQAIANKHSKREDIVDAAYYAFMVKNLELSNPAINITSFIKEGKIMSNNVCESVTRKFLEIRSIEQSADHETIVVLWKDGTKTMLKRSPGDPDDVYMAVAWACVKKIFGTNTHFKKIVDSHVTEHKPRKKKETKVVGKVINKEETDQGLKVDVVITDEKVKDDISKADEPIVNSITNYDCDGYEN